MTATASPMLYDRRSPLDPFHPPLSRAHSYESSKRSNSFAASDLSRPSSTTPSLSIPARQHLAPFNRKDASLQLPGLSALALAAQSDSRLSTPAPPTPQPHDQHHLHQHHAPRPSMSYATVAPGQPSGGMAFPPPRCHNCSTSTTPLWRRDESGSVLCNACGLFLKLHGRPRPISLKTDVIKSRNRAKAPHPNGPGASNQHLASLQPKRSGSNSSSKAGTPTANSGNGISLAASYPEQRSGGSTPTPNSAPSVAGYFEGHQAETAALTAENATLRTRVSELEVINELFRSRVTELEAAESDSRAKIDALSREVARLVSRKSEPDVDTGGGGGGIGDMPTRKRGSDAVEEDRDDALNDLKRRKSNVDEQR